jgi:hypothetical protein
MDASRRESLKGLAAFGLGIGLIGTRAVAAEPPPETTRIRLPKVPSACLAPQYVAEELLRAEGFDRVEYVAPPNQVSGVSGAERLGAGQHDIGMNFAAPIVVGIDRGAPIVTLAGVHAGCFELFVSGNVRTIKDLKGKTVAILARNSAQHVFLASIATSVGLDPNRDIRWAEHPPAEGKRLLAEGGDGYLGFPPDPQAVRRRSGTWRQGVSRPGLQLRSRACPAGAARIAVRQVARLQPGGDAALLRVAPARGRNGQGFTAEDYRRRQRLADRRPLAQGVKELSPTKETTHE